MRRCGAQMSQAPGSNHFDSGNRAQYADLKYSIANLSEMTFVTKSGISDPAAAALAYWKSSADFKNHMLQ